MSNWPLLVFSVDLGAVGLATLSVLDRLRRSPDGVLTFYAIAAGAGAFLGGGLVGALPLIAVDIAHSLRMWLR